MVLSSGILWILKGQLWSPSAPTNGTLETLTVFVKERISCPFEDCKQKKDSFFESSVRFFMKSMNELFC